MVLELPVLLARQPLEVSVLGLELPVLLARLPRKVLCVDLASADAPLDVLLVSLELLLLAL